MRDLLGYVKRVGCFCRDQSEGRSEPGWAGMVEETDGGDHSPGLHLVQPSDLWGVGGGGEVEGGGKQDTLTERLGAESR